MLACCVYWHPIPGAWPTEWLWPEPDIFDVWGESGSWWSGGCSDTNTGAPLMPSCRVRQWGAQVECSFICCTHSVTSLRQKKVIIILVECLVLFFNRINLKITEMFCVAGLCRPKYVGQLFKMIFIQLFDFGISLSEDSAAAATGFVCVTTESHVLKWLCLICCAVVEWLKV